MSPVTDSFAKKRLSLVPAMPLPPVPLTVYVPALKLNEPVALPMLVGDKDKVQLLITKLSNAYVSV